MKLALLFLLIGLNAFFVAVEYAAIASRRARLEMLSARDTAAARLVRSWLQDPAARDRLIAANQIYITLISLAMGALGADAFGELFRPLFDRILLPDSWAVAAAVLAFLPFLLSLLIVTAFQVVLGEQVPKVAVLRAPERFALFAAPVMGILNAVFRRFIDIMDWCARQVLALVGISVATTHTSKISVEELELLVSGPEMEGVIRKPEQDMIAAIFDLRELTVRQVCVPRTEIQAVPESETLPEVVEQITASHFTKLPVYREDLDHVTGILYLRDVLIQLQQPGGRKMTAGELAREALFVPETISVNDLLLQFRSSRQHIAIVLDEFSGTTGLVTLEDLVEEVLGEYRDSFDQTAPPIQTLPGGDSLVDGLTLISDFNAHFAVHLSDSNYHTLAGYILGRLGRMARPGDAVDEVDAGLRFQVEQMDRMRISLVRVSRLDPQAVP